MQCFPSKTPYALTHCSAVQQPNIAELFAKLHRNEQMLHSHSTMPHYPQSAPSCLLGSLGPCIIHSSFESPQAHILNSITSSSALFAGLMVMTNRHTPCYTCSNRPYHMLCVAMQPNNKITFSRIAISMNLLQM